MSIASDEQDKQPPPSVFVVLLVEDDVLFAHCLARLLRASCAVLCARTMSEALELVDRGGFDLLICDYELDREIATPVLLRAKHCWPLARRVVLTGQTAAHVERALPREAAHVVVEKSISVAELGGVIGVDFMAR